VEINQLGLVGRRAQVPEELKRGPFTLDEARRAGLDRWHLEGAGWKRLGPRTYVWSRHAETPKLKIEAALHRLPREAAFSGLTAAWMHGLDVTPCNPIEVTIPKGVGVSARSGIAVRRSALAKSEVVTLRGIRATSIFRTLGDVCARLSLIEAVVIVDMALHARTASLANFTTWVARREHAPGVVSMRRVIGHAEAKSESPMETRLRMLLVLGGLPRPEAQVSLHDHQGRFLGRPDLYYRAHSLGIEYDGGTHRTSLAEDNRRQNRLLNSGIRLLRFTAADVLHAPDSIVMVVRGMLAGDRFSRLDR
jgi:hypothetical protein